MNHEHREFAAIPGSPLDQTIGRLAGYFDAKKMSASCPMCKIADWYFSTDGLFDVNSNWETAHSQVKHYTFTCTNCSFVRRHERSIIDAWNP